MSVPLILAIEPERQQAALLASLVRGRLRAELVLADTTERALVAIGDRVPDLVLIPALLSAQEDAALAGALRMIAAAANVQMLTIPLLAVPAAVTERLGVLAKWRRSKQVIPAAGCDPAVFAEQIASYLADNGEPTTTDTVVAADAPAPALLETLVEGAAATSVVDARGPSDLPRPSALFGWQEAPSASAPTVTPGIGIGDVVVAEVEARSPSDVSFAEVGGPVLSDVIVADEDGAAGAETGLRTELIDELIVHAVAQPREAVAVEAPFLEARVEDAEQLTVTPPSEMALDAGETLTELIPEPASETFAAPRVEQPAQAAAGFDETPIYEVSVDELVCDAALMASVNAMAIHGQSTVVDVDAVAAVAPLEGFPTLDTGPDLLGDVDPGRPAIDVRVPPTPPAAVIAAVVSRAPAKPERPEWVELIESLRQDIERLKAERIAPTSAAAPRQEGPAAVPAPDAGSPTRVVSGVHTPKRPFFPTRKAPRPVQDEWGLFDPDQCGFASLLAKLSEVTEGTDGRGSSRQLNH